MFFIHDTGEYEIRNMRKKQPQIIEIFSFATGKRSGGPIHLTKDGFKNLRGELARLKEAMPDLIAETQRTAAYGDRSDNAEYKEAKSTLRRSQGKIFSIEDQIKRVVIIEPERNISGTVQLGSTVVLEIEDPNAPRGTGRAQKIFQILGSHETDPGKGRISYKSPLGSALMNRAKGDTVEIHPPDGGGGPKKYRILEIR